MMKKLLFFLLCIYQNIYSAAAAAAEGSKEEYEDMVFFFTSKILNPDAEKPVTQKIVAGTMVGLGLGKNCSLTTNRDMRIAERICDSYMAEDEFMYFMRQVREKPKHNKAYLVQYNREKDETISANSFGRAVGTREKILYNAPFAFLYGERVEPIFFIQYFLIEKTYKSEEHIYTKMHEVIQALKDKAKKRKDNKIIFLNPSQDMYGALTDSGFIKEEILENCVNYVCDL